MSLQELENHVEKLSGADLAKFVEWFDTFREAAAIVGDDVTQAQKEELLRRKAEYLRNPDLATPWDDGFFDRLRQRLADARP